MHIKTDIRKLINSSVKTLHINADVDYVVEHPADESHGDYSTNIAMALWSSKEGRVCAKNPKELAEKIVKKIQRSKYISKIEVAGPGFINFFLSDDFFIRELQKILQMKDEYGKPDPQALKTKKISLEHTQINPNKEPHVGHLRNACIGDSLARILRFVGHDVKVQYYQNDVGVQIASIVLAYKKQFVKEGDRSSVIEWASIAYADVEARIKDNPSLAKEKEKIQKNISMQDNEDAKLAHKLTDKVLYEILKIFQTLNIKYDLIVRESDILKGRLWEKTLELLKASEAFYKSDKGEKKGCWLLRLPGADDKVIVRSNGVPTYTGNDIAYHLWKFGVLEDFKYKKLDWDTQDTPLYATASDPAGKDMKGFSPADVVVNIIDSTQTYPQETVKEAIRAIGYPNLADNYHHVNYGFVYLSPKSARKIGVKFDKEETKIKMSGRRGTVIKITQFIEMLKDNISNEYGDFPALEDVVVSAIKFEMLKYDTYQDVVFDIDSALDQKGFSGPYIQYTYARAVSVKRKSGKSDLSVKRTTFSTDLTNEEKMLLKVLYRFPEVVARASHDLAPHHICTYIFNVAQRYNVFYNSNKIIGSRHEEFRLILNEAVFIILKNGLYFLGIQAPEKM